MKHLVLTAWLFALISLPAVADKFSFLTNLQEVALQSPGRLSDSELFFIRTLTAHVDAISSTNKSLTASFWFGPRSVLIGVGDPYSMAGLSLRSVLKELYYYLPYTPKLDAETSTGFTDGCGIDLYCRWLTTLDYMRLFLLTNTVNRLDGYTVP